MVKYLVLLINFAGILLWQLFAPVTITQDFPSPAKAGEEITVRVTINKGDISGFARFQHELPEGFTPTVIEDGGGDFKFEGGKAKFIWMSLPGNDEIKISYKIKIAENVSGEFTVKSKFSYVENGTSQTFNGEDVNIKIEGKTGGITEEDVKTSEPVIPKPEVFCERIVPSGEVENSFRVDVRIRQKYVTAFAKLEDSLPAGFTAEAVSDAGGRFLFEKQKVKFIWMSIPQEEEFTVSYTVIPPAGFSGEVKINGLFSYIENSEPQKFIIPASIVTLKGPAVALNEPDQADGQNETDTQDNKQKVENDEPDSGKPDKTETEKTSEPEITPSGSRGISYKVQIMALHREIPTTYFEKTYGITENVSLEMHEGWIKYTVGGFGEYRNARDHRETVKNKGVAGPFVTAYNQGKRITVQEALMISNQKWLR